MPRKSAHAAPADPTPPVVPPTYHDDRWVEIYPEPAMARDTARALLAAAESLGYDPAAAVVSIGGGFRVPSDVLDATDLPTEPQAADVEAQIPLAAIQAGATPNSTDAGS